MGSAFAAGAGADMLQEILRQKFTEALTKQKLAEDIRQANLQHQIQQGQLGIQQGQLGLGRQRLEQDQSQFEARAPERAATVAHLGAETESLNRAPVEAEKTRQFTAGQNEAGRTFTHGENEANRGNAIKLENLRGAHSLAVANVRGENGPVLKIQTVDENGNPITKIVPRKEAAGQDFAASPTTDQRNRAAAAGRSAEVIKSISELSEKINTGQGALAKIQGAAARAAAAANLNDDVSEYEALVSGFTPLVARAVGHTGVLTEQDVQSVRKMFPNPTDSKSIRDRKIARIEKLMSGMSQPGLPNQSGATENSGRVYYDANGNPIKK